MAKVQPKNTAMVKWDEEMAKQAEIAAGMEATSGGGKFFSTKSGVLSFNDAAFANNQMAVIICDSIFENVFYTAAYDSANPAPPACFAFGRDEKAMAPHQTVLDAGSQQHDQCLGCPMNEWGTAEKGKGKACGNRRRLALIPAGDFDSQGRFRRIDEPEHYQTAEFGFLKLAPTSIKGYAGFVKQLAAVMKRPPHGVITKVKLVPDAKSQFRVVFEPLEPVPTALLPIIMQRNEEAKSVIDFPYQLDSGEAEAEQAPPPPARRQAAKPAARVAKPVPKVPVRPAAKPGSGRKY